MSKYSRIALSIVIFFSFFIIIINVNKEVENVFLGIGDKIKMSFSQGINAFSRAYSKHFDQAREIESLREKTLDYEILRLKNTRLEHKNAQLAKLHKVLTLDSKSSYYPAYITSYTNLFNFNSAWLHVDKSVFDALSLEENNIFGLVRDGRAIGVARLESGRLRAYFNHSEECIYSVYILDELGKKNYAILQGSDAKNKTNIIYIEKDLHLKEGDNIFTSGLDGIFIPDVVVGKIAHVYMESEFARAEVVLDELDKDMGYVWIVNALNSIDATSSTTNGESTESDAKDTGNIEVKND